MDIVMSGQHEIPFGKFKGHTIQHVADTSPFYVLWIAGITSKFSIRNDVKQVYEKLIRDHPDTIQHAKTFIRDKCSRCLGNCGEECIHIVKTRNYHYHPYGKRDG